MLLVSLAHAHVPHDTVTGVAAPADLDPSVPFFVFSGGVGSGSMIFRSDDGGELWEGTYAECGIDPLTDAATTTDGRYAVVGDGRYWWTADGGTWAEVALPFVVDDRALAGGDALFFGTTDGVWQGAAGDVPVLSLAGVSVVSIQEGVGGPVAVGDDGTLYRYDGSGWDSTSTAVSGAVARVATSDGAYLYAGYDDGSAWRWDGSRWTACGTDPLAAVNPLHPEVVALATDGATLLLAHADAGPAASTDGCVTWVDGRAPSDLVWPEDGASFSASVDTAVTHLSVAGSRWLIAGYDSVYYAEAGEWRAPPLRQADAVRSLVFSADFATDGTVLVGVLGCGVARTQDGGSTWDCPGIGLSASSLDVQEVVVPSDASGVNPAYATLGRRLVRSTDGARTWSAISGPFTAVDGKIEAGRTGRLWATGITVSSGTYPGDVAYSDDQGTTWSAVTGFPADLGSRAIGGVSDRGRTVLAWSDLTVYRSSDDGVTFTAIYTDGDPDGTIREAVFWPDTTPTRVVVADGSGVWSRARTTWSLAYDSGDADVLDLVVTDDDTLFAVTEGQRILRSDDAGVSWSDIGVELDGYPAELAPAPDFATTGELLVGTTAGAYQLDATGTLSRWMGYQRYDDQSAWVECATCTAVSAASASLGGVSRIPVGGKATTYARGSTIRVIGSVSRGSRGSLMVDGATVATYTLASRPAGSTLVEATGLTDGQHYVEVAVTGRGTIQVDAIEGIGASSPLTGAPPASSFRTEEPATAVPIGCVTGGSAGGWLGAALGALLARRRSASRS